MKIDRAWGTGLIILGLLCSCIVTPIIMKYILTEKPLVCGYRNSYTNSIENYENPTDIPVGPHNHFAPIPTLSKDLISMDYDLMATKNNPHLIIFMLNLPKRISIHLK